MEIANAVRAGKVTARQMVEQCLDSIRKNNGPINAFVYLDEQGAHILVNAAGLELVADHFSCTNPYIAWNALAAVRLRQQFEYDGYLPDRLEEISPGPRRFIERYAYQDSDQLVEFQQITMRAGLPVIIGQFARMAH
jgi:hypothetical protein